MPTPDMKDLFGEFDHRARVEDETLFVVRDKAPSRRIAKLLPMQHDRHWIFCGSIGSGKSSELAYLGEILKNDYFVVGLDLDQSIHNVHTIQPTEVLMLIGAATVRTVHELWGGQLPIEQIEELQNAFMGVLDEIPGRPEPARILEGVALLSWALGTGDLKTAGKTVASAVSSMGSILKGKRRAPLGGLTRSSLREGDPYVSALVDAVNAILDQVREEYQREPLVLVDGLDKLDEMGIIRQLFCARLLTDVRAASVYCAPITMVLEGEWGVASSFFEQARLTNVVVAPHGDISPEQIENGRALLREVVKRRLGRHGLTEHDVFEKGALDLIITESGGVLRTLVRLVSKSIERAYLDDAVQITLGSAQDAIDELAREYAITMNGRRRAELKIIEQEGEPSGDPTSLKLLLRNYALLYGNGETWWAPAPLVARIL